MYASELSRPLLERADCATLTFLSGELASTRGDVVSSFWPVFEKGTAHCPAIRDRLRTIVADANLPSAARGNASALLGTFRDPADVPLLVEALERPPSDTTSPAMRRADPT